MENAISLKCFLYVFNSYLTEGNSVTPKMSPCHDLNVSGLQYSCDGARRLIIEVSVVEGFVSLLSLFVRVEEKEVVKKCLFLPDVAHFSHSHIISPSCGFEL